MHLGRYAGHLSCRRDLQREGLWGRGLRLVRAIDWVIPLPAGTEGSCAFASGIGMSGMFEYESEIPFRVIDERGQERVVGVPWDAVECRRGDMPGPMRRWDDLTPEEMDQVIMEIRSHHLLLAANDAWTGSAGWREGVGPMQGITYARDPGQVVIAWTDGRTQALRQHTLAVDGLYVAKGSGFVLLHRGNDVRLCWNRPLALIAQLVEVDGMLAGQTLGTLSSATLAPRRVAQAVSPGALIDQLLWDRDASAALCRALEGLGEDVRRFRAETAARTDAGAAQAGNTPDA